jgi:hypothetical protein
MGEQTSDFATGVWALAVFLVFVFTLGWLIAKFRNARFAAAWAPLKPIVGGTVIDDSGGGTTSYLAGAYRGRRVRATMAPGINRYSGEDGGHRYNFFEVALLDEAGQHDWRVEYAMPVMGFGKSGWQIEAEDPALAERLRHANPAALIAAGQQKIVYDRRTRSLAVQDDITPQVVPSPEAFERHLQLVLTLGKLNEELNPRRG